MTSTTRSRARRFGGAALIGAAALLLAFASAAASEPAQEAAKKANRYIGAQKCKNCHGADESGNQHGVWSKMKHANAFATLASEEAQKIAKEKGIEDPQKSDECLSCHTTAFGVPAEQIAKGFDVKLGVQCESCHGPGEQHMKARFAAAAALPEGAPKVYAAPPEGEMENEPAMATCLGCHNEKSPGFKPFCFYKARSETLHLNPLKPRTEEEKAAFLVCGCGEACACKNGCEEGQCAKPAGEVK